MQLLKFTRTFNLALPTLPQYAHTIITVPTIATLALSVRNLMYLQHRSGT